MFGRNTLFSVFFLLGFALSLRPAHGEAITWEIDVNTVGVQGQAGFLDVAFSAGNGSGFDPAEITVANFQTDGSVTGELSPINDVTGTLPGNVELDNLMPTEYTAEFSYGTFFDFSLTLNIPTVSGDAQFGSTFLLSTWDSNFNNLLTVDGGPGLIEADLTPPDDSFSIQNFSSGNLVAVSSAPEPVSFLLLAAGLIGIGLIGNRRSRRGMLSSIPSHGSGQPHHRAMD